MRLFRMIVSIFVMLIAGLIGFFGGRCFCKRGLAYCGLYDLRIYERSQKGMGDHGNTGSLQRTGKQGTVHHGRPEDQCGGFNQCRTAF